MVRLPEDSLNVHFSSPSVYLSHADSAEFAEYAASQKARSLSSSPSAFLSHADAAEFAEYAASQKARSLSSLPSVAAGWPARA